MAAVESRFHPQHPLATCSYSEASTFPCALCERIVTGDGYRCRQCAFHIHEACAKLPYYVSLGEPPRYWFTLTDLAVGEVGVGRRCYVCGQSTRRYMYRCDRAGFDMHLGCVPPQPQPQPQPQRQPQPQQPRPRNPAPNWDPQPQQPRPRNPAPNWDPLPQQPRPRNPAPNWDRAGRILGGIGHTALHAAHVGHNVYHVYHAGHNAYHVGELLYSLLTGGNNRR